MKHFLLRLALAFAVSALMLMEFSLGGFDKSALPAENSPTIKLTYDQISALQAALAELDGPREQVAADGRVIKRGLYDFDMRTVLLIADNTARTKECRSIYEFGQNATQKKWADAKTGRVTDENMNAYITELNESGKAVCTAKEFVPIKWEDLKVSPTGPNKFPASVVTGLLPILIVPETK